MKLLKGLSSARGTKRALIASAACTLLCGLLLFSTSIAWFTANKESKVNELYSGNLDIELFYSKDMETWNEVKDEENLFQVNGENMLWEPGAVNVVYFKIENKGSLAAKYDFALAIENEVGGKNFNDETFKLSDYIKGGVVEDVAAAFGGEDEDEQRAAAIEAVKDDAKKLSEINGAPLITGEMNGTEEHPNIKTFALVLYMPQYVLVGDEHVDVGAKINYPTPDDENARPKVPLKVKLVATQDVGENDSFGNQYDKGAYEIKVPVGSTNEETKNNIATAISSATKGSTVLLPKMNETIVLPNIPENVTIKGDGTTQVVLDNNVYGASAAALPNGATLEKIVLDCGDSLYHGFQHSGPIEFKDCTIKGKLTLYGPTVFTNCIINTTTPSGADYIWTYGCDVTFDNCTFNTIGKAILCYNEGSGSNNVTVKNCTFNATAGATAGEITNQNCAAIEINNFGCGVNLILKNNTVTKGNNAFSGEWRIKNYVEPNKNNKIIINGVEYNTTALDGKTMTVSNKIATVNN